MKNTMVQRLSLGRLIAICILFVAALIGGLVHFGAQSSLLRFFDWLDALGAWAPLLFMLIDMLVVVLVLPGVMFTLGAGFLFGVVKGSLYVVIATTVGATLAFMIARLLFGERASKYVLSHSKLKLVSDQFTHEGWRIVLLTRLVPFFPFKLSNYFFGLTKISLRGFILGVFFGIWPITINNVYIGSIAADLATLGSRNSSRSWVEWAVYGIGFVAAIATVLYVTRVARRALDKHISNGGLS
jgi:uncharacterized membrane protein YdjX (TVP38/TMEM64 family)